MNAQEILHRLTAERVQVHVSDGKLKLRGGAHALRNADFLRLLRDNRQALLELIAEDSNHAPDVDQRRLPPNLIPTRAAHITPEMLTLVELSPAEIQRVVDTVSGGSENVQDIYPLAPLQEGFLFHHLLDGSKDPYLGSHLFEFDTRSEVAAYVAALQAVVARHDILRTAFVWEGLSRPVQVVWRAAQVQLSEVEPEPSAQGDAAEWLLEVHGARRERLDLSRAPLLRLFLARDRRRDGWLLLELMHHLVGDHTTLDVMQQEIEAHLCNRQSSLPAPTPFRNLVFEASSEVRRAADERFFSALLGDFTVPSHAFGVSPQPSNAMDEHRFRLSEDDCHRISGQARRAGVSPAALFHLAWAQVLARASGRDDVVFGTVLFGRMNGGEASDRTLGMFVNTLPVRVRVDARPVGSALRETQELLTELLYYEHAALVQAQRMSGVRAPEPLFSALLNFRHTQAEAPPATAATGRFRFAEESTTYPLVLNVNANSDGFSLAVQATAPASAERVVSFVVSALLTLTQALEAGGHVALDELDVLPSGERRRLLRELGSGKARAPARLLPAFEGQVTRAPTAPAVRFRGVTLSYGELAHRVGRLSRRLRKVGVGREVRVGVCLERGPHLIVALLAILAAGGAYVPLDSTHPGARLRTVLEDATPEVVLVDAHTRRLFDLEFAPCVADRVTLDLSELESIEETASDEGGAWAEPASTDLAYIIYTSGSTGKPKGVMVEHGGLGNLLADMAATTCTTSADRVLALTTLAFDIAGLELFMPLMVGGCVVLADTATARDPFALAGLLDAEHVTLMQATPSTWRMMTSSGWLGSSSLTKALCGGEPMSRELAGELLRRVPRVWNVYGPTETTIWSSCDPVSLDANGAPSIGRPIANTTMYVLDSRGRPAPIGASGELCIGGSGVARGYLGRPELTSARFVEDPFVRGGRMYKTGDLASFNTRGGLDFLGRNDGQIKLRGFRIELGEIESRLAEHDGVADAVVVLVSPADHEAHLVAYCVLEPDAEMAEPARELRAFLCQTLPAYMIPAAIRVLPGLPLTPNGKVDRKALAALPAAPSVGARRETDGMVECAIASAWKAVLGVERVGAGDSFFDLGGNSLSAVMVLSRLRAQGLQLELADLLRGATVADVAALLPRSTTSNVAECSVVRGGPGAGMFLVHEYLGLDWYFAPLTAHIAAGGPVHGLRAVSLGSPQPDTLVDLAARLVRLMRATQPAGPYRLCGWSFGGLLAYEAARQLLAAGERVELLTLIDTALSPPALSAPLTSPDALRELLQSAAGSRPRLEAESTADDIPSLLARWRALGAELPPSLSGLSDRQIELFCERIVAHRRAWEGYVPKPIPLSINLLIAREGVFAEPHSSNDIVLGWNNLLGEGQVRVTSVPGDHFSMMAPGNIGEVGRAIGRAPASLEEGSHA